MQPSTPPCSVMIHEEVTCVVVISSFICIAIFTAFGSSLVDVIPKIFDIGKYIFGKLYIFITIIRFFRAIIIYIKLTYKGLVITYVINQYLISMYCVLIQLGNFNYLLYMWHHSNWACKDIEIP